MKGWTGSSRIARGVSYPVQNSACAAFHSLLLQPERENRYKLPAVYHWISSYSSFFSMIRTRIYASNNWTRLPTLSLSFIYCCAQVYRNHLDQVYIDSAANQLQITWEKTVTVAGWQMVQTPNYIAPAIGTSIRSWRIDLIWIR